MEKLIQYYAAFTETDESYISWSSKTSSVELQMTMKTSTWKFVDQVRVDDVEQPDSLYRI